MKVTRAELYKMVWAEPMISICKKYGLSDNGLRKHCKKLNIPTPPVGYWEKLKHGKNPEMPPLPKETEESVPSTELSEREIVLVKPPDRKKIREAEIANGDISIFTVPEVLYAKDPLIIDTIERKRMDSENSYMRKNPYKVKTGPPLDVKVSDSSLRRALAIFETIIKVLRCRGSDVRVKENLTYAVINSEEIQINITEKNKQISNTVDTLSKYNHVPSGYLNFNILYKSWDKDTFSDTAHTKLEDKIIAIIANLEVRAEKIKEERIEAERRRIEQEKQEKLRREFKEMQDAEKKEFKSLFRMAEQLHKTQILRHFISTFEDLLNGRGEMDKESASKIQWAKEKADWLDPFISKSDKYLDSCDKNELIQPECPKKDSWGYSSYSDYYSAPKYSFWSNPWRNRR
jgi:hypothetical protein